MWGAKTGSLPLTWQSPLQQVSTTVLPVIDKLLPESFQTTVGISRVGMVHPDFFQGGRLPTLPPTCWRPWRYKRISNENRRFRPNVVSLT